MLANSSSPTPGTIGGEVIVDAKERSVPSFLFFDGKGDEVGGMLFHNEATEDGFYASRHFSLDGYQQDQTVVLHHYQQSGRAVSGLTVSNRPDQSIPDSLAQLGLQPGHTRAQFEAAVAAIPKEQREAKMRELFGVTRAFVGSSDGEAGLKLRDGQGRPRIYLGVPADGEPFIRVLDEKGNIVAQLPNRQEADRQAAKRKAAEPHEAE